MLDSEGVDAAVVSADFETAMGEADCADKIDVG